MDKGIAIIQKLAQQVINEDQGPRELFVEGSISNDDIYKLILPFKILQTKTSLLII